MANDPGRWGHSLGNLAEIWIPVLAAASPRCVVEVGAYAGDTSRILLDWALDSGARIVSIDPNPQEGLVQLARENPALELVRATSHEALPTLPEPPDAVIIDGDHNYYTVSEELRLIEHRTGAADLPLIVCHDVCWPHGRRDAYYSLEQVPEQNRQPTVGLGHLFPGDPGIPSGGLLLFQSVAEREGGPRNGVLTAIEDFVGSRRELRLAVVPVFFGLGLIWRVDAPWAAEVAAALEPWTESSLLTRLERNRVVHLASSELERARAEAERERADWFQRRCESRGELLSRLLQSRTFTVAVWLSRLRRGGRPAFSKDELRRLLHG